MVPPSGCASSPKETNAELCVTAIHPGRALHVGCGAPPASGPGARRLRRLWDAVPTLSVWDVCVVWFRTGCPWGRFGMRCPRGWCGLTQPIPLTALLSFLSQPLWK